MPGCWYLIALDLLKVCDFYCFFLTNFAYCYWIKLFLGIITQFGVVNSKNNLGLTSFFFFLGGGGGSCLLIAQNFLKAWLLLIKFVFGGGRGLFGWWGSSIRTKGGFVSLCRKWICFWRREGFVWLMRKFNQNKRRFWKCVILLFFLNKFCLLLLNKIIFGDNHSIWGS